MLTKIHTYEGVPVGSENFDDLLNYITSFLADNFNFSTYFRNQQGGYFKVKNLTEPFRYVTKGTDTGGNSTAVFLMPEQETGILYGSKDGVYYRFEKLGPFDSTNPEVQRWELLPTNASESNNIYTFSNSSLESKTLPYNPLKLTSNDVSPGYNYISYNGVYQSIISNYTLDTTNYTSTFRQQNLNVTKVQLGAESPVPIDKNNRFYGDLAFYRTYDKGAGITKNDLASNFDNKLTFSHTNFKLQGHILLTRESSVGGTPERTYVYVPQDMSNGTSVSLGYYKVVDSSVGEIQLNLSNAQLQSLVTSGEVTQGTFADDAAIAANMKFFVVSGEQLLVDFQTNLTNYKSNYGTVYNGNDAEVRVVIVNSDNNSYQVVEDIDSVVTATGDTILQDTEGQYDNSIVLALAYSATPSLSKYQTAQRNKFSLDIFELYYHSGVNVGDETNMRAFVEENPSSWYNQKISSGEYKPVARGTSTYLSFITATEASGASFTNHTTFDPKTEFAVSDQLQLAGLADIQPEVSSTGLDTNDTGNVLVYDNDSQVFNSTAYRLSALTDTVINNPVNNTVLTYDNTQKAWIPKNVTTALGYTPLNKTGDTVQAQSVNDTGRLNYAAPLSFYGEEITVDVNNSANNVNEDTLVTAEYVVEAIEQNVLSLNTPQTDLQTSTNDIGFVFHRYATPDSGNNEYNVSLIWKEDSDYLAVGSTLNSEDQNGVITLDNEWFVINDTGQVGIQTNSPSTELDVSGTITSTVLNVTDSASVTNEVSAATFSQNGNSVLDSSLLGVSNGVAQLDANGTVPSSQLPTLTITDVYVVADNTERDALSVQTGDVANVTSTGLTFIWDGSNWVEITASSDVVSVNGETGTVSLNSDNIPEGTTNLYYSSSLFDADFSGKTTDDLTEGTTNLYYSSTLTNSDIDTRVTKAFVDALNVDADTLDTLDSASFVRTDSSTTISSGNTLTIDGNLIVNGSATLTTVDAGTLDGLDSTDFVQQTDVGSANGVVPLNSNTLIDSVYLPDITKISVTQVTDIVARDALTVESGDIAQVTSTGLTYIYDGTTWQEITASGFVTSVNSQSGDVTLNTDDVSEGSTNKYYSSTLANSDIDARVDKAFVDALNVDADTLDGFDSTAFAAVNHNHTSSDITDFSTAVQTEVDKTYVDSLNVDADTLDGQDSTAFASASHTHVASEITDFSTAVQTEVNKTYVDSLNVDADTLDGVDSTAFVLQSEVGSANGVAELDANGVIPSAQLPTLALSEVYVVVDNTERDALTVQEGDIAKVTSTGLTFIWDGTVWVEITADSAVDSVNGQTGTVSLNTDDVTQGTTNLYYASSLFDADFSTKTTDDLTEGTTNKYYDSALTNADIDTRVDKAFVDALNVDADTLDGQDSTAFAAASHTHTLSDITDAGTAAAADTADFATAAQGSLADTAVQPGDDADTLGSGDALGGYMLTADGLGGAAWEEFSAPVTTVNTQTGDVTLTTDDVNEGTTNLYYSSTLFDADFTSKTTDDLSEGLTNKYYSTTLANTDIDARVDKTFVDALNIDADTLDGLDSTEFAQLNSAPTFTGTVTADNVVISDLGTIGSTTSPTSLTINASGVIDFTVMPTQNSNPIVESDSNSDGEWTRWADGTQWVGTIDQSADMTTDAPQQYVYPQTFTQVYSVTFGMNDGIDTVGDESAVQNSFVSNRNNTRWEWECDGSGTSPATGRLIFGAIGRWF